MTPLRRLGFLAALVGLGIGWGSTQSLGKIAVSTGYRQFGLIFWQLVIGILLLGAIQILRRKGVPLTRPAMRFALVIGVIGTIIPNSTFFLAVAHLPAGIMSILISMVPLLSLPIAIALGMDRFSGVRLAGLLCGLAGVALIGLPRAALPGDAALIWLAVALVGPFFYALEGNIVAKWGTAGLDPVQAILAASAIAAVLVLPLALVSGQWIDPTVAWGAPEWALIVSSVINVAMYVGYIWLAQAAGAVFAAQVGYIVTASGVGWAMLLLGERFSPVVFLAAAIMACGLWLVQPRAASVPDTGQ